MNRKERRLALRTAFFSRVDELVVVEDFASQLVKPSTKEMIGAVQRWGATAGQRVLIIVADMAESENVYRSARNVNKLKMISANGLNIYDVLHADVVIVTKSALTKIQEIYSDD
jgi:large subunit ribosomal protein L4